MKDLQTALSHERGSNASSLQELKESRSRIDLLMSKVSDLEAANLNLNQKISDMAHNMDDLKSGHRAQVIDFFFNHAICIILTLNNFPDACKG